MAEGIEVQPMAALKVKRALLSVTDKRGIAEFSKGLAELGVEILSTGGTSAEVEAAGVQVRQVDDYTGFPEILDGRVKTLHPRIYAGLLAVRSNEGHLKTLEEHEIEPIDLVCVNLYRFAEAAFEEGLNEDEVLEQIDIGGPTLIRAAAKNYPCVAVVVTPESYDAVLEELRDSGGELSLPTREALATEAFALSAGYDAAISTWFSERDDEFPQIFVRAYDKVLDLSYGENPHQRGAFYADSASRTHLLSHVAKLHGKSLSYNNLLDLNSARKLVEEFDRPAAVIIKHNNPCGCAVAEDIQTAYERALACDPTSAFGGVICLNRAVDKSLAEKLHEKFIELVFAPEYEEKALEVLMSKPNVRVLRDDERRERLHADRRDLRRVMGGLLVQDPDTGSADREDMEVVTKKKPTEEEWSDMLFAWRVCKHVKSNAIVFAGQGATLGIGAGQMSRVDSVDLAVKKAEQKLEGTAVASDAFFPFPDAVEAAIEAGATTVIQPGGSVRDQNIIDACDKHGVAMAFTHHRHFRH